MFEPTCGDNLLAIQRNVAGIHFRETADHEIGGEWPRLTCKIPDRVGTQPNFFKNFTRDGFLDCFTGFDEARESRVEAACKTFVAAQQAMISPCDEHDHGWIGAREMFRAATATNAAIPAIRHRGRSSTFCAETVPVVPVDQSLGLSKNRGVGGVEQPGCGSGIPEVAVVRQCRGQRISQRGDIARKKCAVLPNPEKNFDGCIPAESGRELSIDKAKLGCARAGFRTKEQRLQLPKRQHTRLRA